MRFRSTLVTVAFGALPGLLIYSTAFPQPTQHKKTKPGAKAAPPAASPTQAAYAKEIVPLVKQFCGGCHSGASPAAGLALTSFPDVAAVLKARDVWANVATNVQNAHMPPDGAPHPTQAQRDLLVHWVAGTLAMGGPAEVHEHVTLRRLNRTEYNNTIRDLLGVEFHPADDFPADDVGYGFDNIGEVLSLSPLLLEKYLSAAEKVAQAAIITPEAAPPQQPGTPTPLPPFQQKINAYHPTPATREAVTRKILADFARRAYRRPVTQAEVDRLVRCAMLAKREGESFERGIQLGVEAALVSPSFLFRAGADPKPSKAAVPRLLNDYEIASRLSYFLWSSMPDEALFTLAQKGKLHDPTVLSAQVKRMLRDPKAQALADNFAGQWLQLRNLANVAPDHERFPDFNDTLRAAMRTETEMFFESIVNEDHSVLDFLSADYTFLNEPLAKHYGITGVTGDNFRRVTLTGDQRGGLLSQASILTVTSNPTRTSPVKRGKWVLEQLLGTPLPPPLPGVGQLPDDKQGPLVGTLRQRMEQHRKNPICASCHARMDPIGFGLENYDAVGGWRTQDGNLPIDASGVLPDGKSFNGPAQLKTILLSKKDQFVHCLSEKLLIYALGRGLDPPDERAVDTVVAKTAKQGYRFSALITAIVQSDPFRLRKGKGA